MVARQKPFDVRHQPQQIALDGDAMGRGLPAQFATKAVDPAPDFAKCTLVFDRKRPWRGEGALQFGARAVNLVQIAARNGEDMTRNVTAECETMDAAGGHEDDVRG